MPMNSSSSDFLIHHVWPEETFSREYELDDRRRHASEAVHAAAEDEIDLPKNFLRNGDLPALLAVSFLDRGGAD